MIKKIIALSAMFAFSLFALNVSAQDDAAATEQSAAMEETAPADVEPAPVASGSVSRSAFTTAIVDREPADDISTLDTNSDKVFFFTELVDFGGQTVTHRWEYNGQNMAEVKFNVGGSRWRVHSSKNFVPEWVGTWTVSVIDGNGQVVSSKTLEYTAAAAPATTEPEKSAADDAASGTM